MASSVNRIVGNYAFCTIGHVTSATVLNLTDWQVQIRSEFVDATGFGDFWDVPVVIKYLWTARARGYFSNTLSYLNAYQQAVTAQTDVLEAQFVGYIDQRSTPIFSAFGFVERAAFMVPNAMLEQEIELRGVGNPILIT